MARKLTLNNLGLPVQIGIGVVLLALGGVFYFVSFWSPISNDLNRVGLQRAQLRKDITKAEDDVKKYQADLEELYELEARQREFNKILPEQAQKETIVSELGRTAEGSGVDFVSYQPLEERPQDFFYRVPFRLRLVGKFHQLAKFFHSVGQLDRIMNVEDVSLRLTGGSVAAKRGDVLLEATVNVTAFRLKPADAAADAADKRGRRKGK